MLAQIFDTRCDLLLEQRKKQVFLACEIGVKSASCIAGIGGDFFQFGGIKTVARKYLFRGLKKPGAREVRLFLVAGSWERALLLLW